MDPTNEVEGPPVNSFIDQQISIEADLDDSRLLHGQDSTSSNGKKSKKGDKGIKGKKSSKVDENGKEVTEYDVSEASSLLDQSNSL